MNTCICIFWVHIHNYIADEGKRLEQILACTGVPYILLTLLATLPTASKHCRQMWPLSKALWNSATFQSDVKAPGNMPRCSDTSEPQQQMRQLDFTRSSVVKCVNGWKKKQTAFINFLTFINQRLVDSSRRLQPVAAICQCSARNHTTSQHLFIHRHERHTVQVMFKSHPHAIQILHTNTQYQLMRH